MEDTSWTSDQQSDHGTHMSSEEDKPRRVRIVDYVPHHRVKRKPLSLEEKIADLVKFVDDPEHGVFESVIKGIHDHDKTCQSLPETWVGRRGGVSCPSDWFICYKCELSFLWGASGSTEVWLLDKYDGEEEYYDENVCECCSRGEKKVEYDKNWRLVPLEKEGNDD